MRRSCTSIVFSAWNTPAGLLAALSYMWRSVAYRSPTLLPCTWQGSLASLTKCMRAYNNSQTMLALAMHDLLLALKTHVGGTVCRYRRLLPSYPT